MGGIKKKLQRLFGGGKKKSRRDGNLSEIGREEGLGGIGLTGLGMTEAGTDLGDWGNGAILDELQPPPVPGRKDRPQLTTARLDNPTGMNGRNFLTTARTDNPIVEGLSGGEDLVESSGETTLESSLESSGDTTLESSLESSGDTTLESSLESSSGTSQSGSSLESSRGGYVFDESFEPDSSKEDDDDLDSLPTLGLVSKDEPPEPVVEHPPKYSKIAPLGKNYEGEDVDAKWRSRLANPTGGMTTTEYLEDEGERAKRRVEVDEQGRLTRNGELLTTGSTNEKGEVRSKMDLFAMNPEGDIQSSNQLTEEDRLEEQARVRMDEEAKRLGKNSWEELSDEERAKIIEAGGGARAFFHHSSYYGGQGLGGAGMFKTNEGLLKLITPDSGHHKPETEHTMQVLSELRERGTNLDHTQVGVHVRDENGNVIQNDPQNPRDVQTELFHAGEMFESGGDEKNLMGKKSFVHQIEHIGEKVRHDEKLSMALEEDIEDRTIEDDENLGSIEDQVRRRIEEKEQKKGVGLSLGNLETWEEEKKDQVTGEVKRDSEGNPKMKTQAIVQVLKDLADPMEMLRKARKRPGGKEAPVPPPMPSKPKDFLDRGKTGSDPKGPKKYDQLAPLGHDYRGEHEQAKWRAGGERDVDGDKQHMRTVALTDEGRDKRRLHVGEDGLLYDSSGLLMDTSGTSGKIRKDMDEGAWLFGMDETGDILSTDAYEETFNLRKQRDEFLERKSKGEQTPNRGEGDYNFFHHSSFFGGRDLAGAGGLSVREGKLKLLTANSGHHKGGNQQTLNVMEELVGRGLDTSDLRVDMMSKSRAGSEDRELGGKRMQYLAGGLVEQALGTEEDKGKSREKTTKRLDTHMDMLEQINEGRYHAGQTDDTRKLEDEIAKAMLDGASSEKIREYVEGKGFEVAGFVGDGIRIYDPNAVSPSTMLKVSNKKNLEKLKEDESQRRKTESTARQERTRERMDGKRTMKQDRLNLPEWAQTDKLKEKIRKAKEKEQSGGGYTYDSGPTDEEQQVDTGSYSYGSSVPKDEDEKVEVAQYTYDSHVPTDSEVDKVDKDDDTEESIVNVDQNEDEDKKGLTPGGFLYNY